MCGIVRCPAPALKAVPDWHWVHIATERITHPGPDAEGLYTDPTPPWASGDWSSSPRGAEMVNKVAMARDATTASPPSGPLTGRSSTGCSGALSRVMRRSADPMDPADKVCTMSSRVMDNHPGWM